MPRPVVDIRSPARLAIVAAPLVALAAGCAPTKPSDQTRESGERSGPAAGQVAGERDRHKIVARVNGEAFTLGDLEERIDRLPPYVRTKFRGPGGEEGSGSVEKKQQYLEGLVQFELLADLAEARGLGDHPTVRHLTKEWLAERAIETAVRREVSMSEISREAIEQRYREDDEAYREPEKRRGLVVVTESRRRAERLRAELLAGDYESVDAKLETFRQIASRSSVDPKSARRGGRIGAVEPPSAGSHTQAVADAIFGLDERGEISEVFEADGRWYLATWSDKRDASTTPLAEAEREIRSSLYEERKEARRDEITARWREDATVERTDDLAERLDEPELRRATRPGEIPIVAASEVDADATSPSNDE